MKFFQGHASFFYIYKHPCQNANVIGRLHLVAHPDEGFLYFALGGGLAPHDPVVHLAAGLGLDFLRVALF